MAAVGNIDGVAPATPEAAVDQERYQQLQSFSPQLFRAQQALRQWLNKKEDEEEDVPPSEVHYRISMTDEAIIMATAIAVDGVKWIPIVNWFTAPVGRIANTSWFLINGVNPFWRRRITQLAQQNAYVRQKLEKKLERTRARGAAITARIGRMGRLGRWFVSFCGSMMPLISVFPWETWFARSLIKASREEDLENARKKYFSEKYGAEYAQLYRQAQMMQQVEQGMSGAAGAPGVWGDRTRAKQYLGRTSDFTSRGLKEMEKRLKQGNLAESYLKRGVLGEKKDSAADLTNRYLEDAQGFKDPTLRGELARKYVKSAEKLERLETNIGDTIPLTIDGLDRGIIAEMPDEYIKRFGNAKERYEAYFAEAGGYLYPPSVDGVVREKVPHVDFGQRYPKSVRDAGGVAGWQEGKQLHELIQHYGQAKAGMTPGNAVGAPGAGNTDTIDRTMEIHPEEIDKWIVERDIVSETELADVRGRGGIPNSVREYIQAKRKTGERVLPKEQDEIRRILLAHKVATTVTGVPEIKAVIRKKIGELREAGRLAATTSNEQFEEGVNRVINDLEEEGRLQAIQNAKDDDRAFGEAVEEVAKRLERQGFEIKKSDAP